MKTKFITIRRGLLVASLSGFVSLAFAQSSVSSYEKSLENAPAPGQTSTATASSSSAPLDTGQLASQLEAAGWKVTRESNGDLVVVPPEVKTDMENPWKQIQQQLQGTGWYAEQDADGALILIPPGKSTAPVQTTVENASGSEGDSLQTMQQKLRDAGWQVNEASDGSILLYPPGETASNKVRPCPGVASGVNIDLPVDTWQEAFDISRGWLQNQSNLNASVGKIRKIIDVYIVSIVADTAPYTLIHQLAIRSGDGAVIVLN